METERSLLPDNLKEHVEKIYNEVLEKLSLPKLEPTND